MTFAASGWICVNCWKSNRMRDERCYGCKTPRDADPAEVAAARQAAEQAALKAPAAASARAAEPVPDTLVAVPIVVFAWTGWVYRKFAILLVVLSAIGAISDPRLILAGGAAGAVVYGFGWLYRAISDGMRRRAIWAFVVGIAIAGIPTALQLWAVLTLEYPALPENLPGWVETLNNVSIIIGWIALVANGVAAICALIGLVLAMARPAPPPQRVTSPN